MERLSIKNVFYLITYTLLVIVISISVYNRLNPLSHRILAQYSSAKTNVVSLYHTDFSDIDQPETELYRFNGYVPVEYDFGKYYIPVSTRVTVTNNDYENAIIEVTSRAFGVDIVLNADHIRLHGETDENLTLFCIMDIRVPFKQDGVYINYLVSDVTQIIHFPEEPEDEFTEYYAEYRLYEDPRG